MIREAPGMASPSTYRRRFASLRRSYELIGYGCPERFDPMDLRRRTTGLREELIAQIVAMFPNQVSIINRGGRWRSRLRISNGRAISVIVSRSLRIWKDSIRWKIDPVRHERKFMTLLARLDNDNREFQDFYLFPNIDQRRRFRVSLNDEWLSRGTRLSELSQFYEVVKQVARRSGGLLWRVP
jgi:hypothetical protein